MPNFTPFGSTTRDRTPKLKFLLRFDENVEHKRPASLARFSQNLQSLYLISVLQRLHGEVGRTISDVQKRDEQIDRQTNKQKNSTFLAAPAAGEIRAPPNLAR